jgi:cytochrome P450
MPVLTACVNETLRLYPPAAQFARVAAADEVLGGYQIPKGMIVVSSIYNMHR